MQYIVTAEGSRMPMAITAEQEERINKLIPDPTNKKVLYKQDGNTRDIIKEVLQTYADSRNQLKEFGKTLQGSSLLDTCSNIWNFWKYNVNYKIDPDGVQWIKSPSALWNEGNDPFGDCKSFAIAVAASLHALDIKGAFRFVSFGSNVTAPTHVFVVVKNQGQEIIIDCVWHSFNSTKPWAKKWDYNMTSIYSISGIDTSNGRGVLDLDHDNIDGLTQGELDLLARKQLLELEQMKVVREKGIGSTHDNAYEVEIMAHNNALAEIGRVRRKNKFRHQAFINFGHAGDPRKRVPQVAPMLLTEAPETEPVQEFHRDAEAAESVEGFYGDDEIGLFGSKKRKDAATLASGGTVKGKAANKRAQSFIDKQKKRNDAGKGISKNGAKILDKLNIVVKKKKDGLLKSIVKVVTAPVRLVTKAITTTVLRTTLPKNAAFFLYLFLPDNVVAKAPDAVQQKRQKALLAKDSIVKKIGMKEETFTTIIKSGILSRFGQSPEDVLAKWMKDANFSINGILDFLGQGLQALTGALGIDFKNMEDAIPDPSDWGVISPEAKADLANDVKNADTNQLQVKDQSTQQIINSGGGSDKSYTDGSGKQWSSGYTDGNGVHHDDEPGDDEGPSKVLPESKIVATKKTDNTPMYLGLGLLGLMVMSGGPKKKNQ